MNQDAIATLITRFSDFSTVLNREANRASTATDTTITECMELFLQADRAVDELDSYMKICKGVINWYREKIVPDRLRDAGLQNLRMVDGTQIVPTTGIRATINSGMKEQAHDWLRTNGLEDIIVPTVNASTLSALARDWAKENKELPEELFKSYIYTSTSVRSGKASKTPE